MKVTIVGAGAIGGFIGTRLASLPQLQVSAYARGATLEALRVHGWRTELAYQSLHFACAQASDSAGVLGMQDLVVIAVKATALPALAPKLTQLIGPNTLILPAMNGVPWWFMQPATLRSIDPTGSIAAALPAQQSLGCVVHASASTTEPGLVKVKMGNGLIVGDAWDLNRAQGIVDLLKQAGFDVTLSNKIRYDIWYKLWGNMTVNPITAMTGVTADKVFDDDLVRHLCSQCMLEAQAVGRKIGCDIAQTPEDRHQITRKLGAFKTSMLQDVEAGRAVELDALMGVVREIGSQVGVATPTIDSLFGIARLFAQQRGLYP